MASFPLVLLVALASINSLALSSDNKPIYAICNRERNFTANSIFQTNLNSLIASLAASSPDTGFASTTIGEFPDRIFGLAICRGDLNADGCRSCLANSTRDAAAQCPGNKAATIFYELCQFRYSDQSFFGSSTGSEFYMWNVNNVSDVSTFNRLLGNLLNNLTVRAASSKRMFAAGSVDFNDFQKIYALVQCTRDLSPETCSVCLKGQIGDIPSCCAAKQGARVIGGSCYLRYEVGPFYNASAAVDPPPSAAPAPSPNNTLPPGIPAPEGNGSLFILDITCGDIHAYKFYVK